MIRISDAESFAITRKMAREEGLLVGGSSGTAVAAALKYAQRLEQGKNIVVLLPDSGRNYLTKIFSDHWMWENGFLDQAPENVSVGEILRMKDRIPGLLSINADDLAVNAANIMKENSISQLPVLKDKKVVGGINEVTLIKLLYDGIYINEKKVSDIMGSSLPQLDESVNISEIYRLLLAGYGGVIITKNNEAEGFLARIDLVNFWIKKMRARSVVV